MVVVLAWAAGLVVPALAAWVVLAGWAVLAAWAVLAVRALALLVVAASIAAVSGQAGTPMVTDTVAVGTVIDTLAMGILAMGPGIMVTIGPTWAGVLLPRRWHCRRNTMITAIMTAPGMMTVVSRTASSALGPTIQSHAPI